ncbi:MAG TPA: hypothetical protein VIW23_08780 [Candidatus Acidoferrum sp.]|jgi:hypothetical protein
MKLRFQTSILTAGAIICFAEVIVAPKSSDPGPWAAAALGIVLLRRGITTGRQPAVVILSGCILTVLLLAGDHGFLNINNPAWLALIIVAGFCYAFWERVERLWT